MHYDIIVNKLIEGCLTSLIYIKRETVIEQIKDDDGNVVDVGQIDKKTFEDIVKSIDYIPFIEVAMDMVEDTREFDEKK